MERLTDFLCIPFWLQLEEEEEFEDCEVTTFIRTRTSISYEASALYGFISDYYRKLGRLSRQICNFLSFKSKKL